MSKNEVRVCRVEAEEGSRGTAKLPSVTREQGEGDVDRVAEEQRSRKRSKDEIGSGDYGRDQGKSRWLSR